MNDIIDTVVGHFANRVNIWNVVNEAVDEDGSMRLNHAWGEAMGVDYIRKAFVRARAADPTAVLHYNDYDIEVNELKFNGVKALLQDLLDQGTPVDALGWQMHVKPLGFDPETWLARLNEIADMGLDNYITELDVELPVVATSDDYENQKQTYKSVIDTFLKARRHQSIVVWGLRDGDPGWFTELHPLPFDEGLAPKPAYFGIREALQGP